MPELLGVLPSPPDPRDYPVAMALAREAPAIPSDYRLTQLTSMPPVYEQIGPTCVTSAICGMAEFHERRETGGSVRLDDDEMYARCKDVDGYPGDGTYPRVGMDVWLKRGIQTDAGRGGLHFAIKAYYSVPVDPSEIARVVFEKGQPVSLAMSWPSTWWSPPPNGVMPQIVPGSYAGGHQVYVWGYDFTRPERGLLCRNSWSREWGLYGSFWLGSQAWTIPGLIWEAWYGESA
jgi:hypothetical protein